MKSFITILFFFVSTLVTAQAVQEIPECVQPCLKASIAAAGCLKTDLACMCGPKADSIQSGTSTCLGAVTNLTLCSANDIAASALASRAICDAFKNASSSGVTIPSSASSTVSIAIYISSATASTNSSSSSTASTSPASSSNRAAAIGTGVPVGFFLLAGLISLGFCIRQRHLQKRGGGDIDAVELGIDEKEAAKVYQAPRPSESNKEKVVEELDGRSLKPARPMRPARPAEVYELAS